MEMRENLVTEAILWNRGQNPILQFALQAFLFFLFFQKLCFLLHIFFSSNMQTCCLLRCKFCLSNEYQHNREPQHSLKSYPGNRQCKVLPTVCNIDFFFITAKQNKQQKVIFLKKRNFCASECWLCLGERYKLDASMAKKAI